MTDKIYNIFCICTGASAGALLRYFTYSWVNAKLSDTFWATVTVNLLGSFLIGVLFTLFNEINSPRLQLLLITGLLASFTTFSTFSLDALRLLSNQQFALGALIVIGQVILGICFCYFGVKISQRII